MDVKMVSLPPMAVALVEHRGAPAREYDTLRRLLAWRREHRLHPDDHASYGLHYTDPRVVPASAHRVDFCVAYDGEVAPNPYGVCARLLPGGRYAHARDVGSREDNQAAAYLYDVWLPQSGEKMRAAPLVFHYVNVGPDVRPEEMITDVYLPLV